MREYRISVTQDDIRAGKRHNERECPIAHAWNRATDGGLMMFLPIESLPWVAQDFLRRYDRGEHVEPFQFIMEVR